jgi:putative restriction endonuclease
VSFGSFQKGIHRSSLQRGPAALTLTTSFKDPYADAVDPGGSGFVYAYRAGSVDQADNRALRAAHALRAPIIYFRALAPGMYWTSAPMFVVSDDPVGKAVVLEAALPLQDMTPEGLVSGEDVRAYATVDARIRLHQQKFRIDVLRAYRSQCAICRLREAVLVEAAHIVSDAHAKGIAAVINGIALCAIHHLAYDRNLMGIDPTGVVHISERLLHEHDGPMLTSGIQAFHGSSISMPSRPADRPDPHRLEIRFDEFRQAAA